MSQYEFLTDNDIFDIIIIPLSCLNEINSSFLLSLILLHMHYSERMTRFDLPWDGFTVIWEGLLVKTKQNLSPYQLIPARSSLKENLILISGFGLSSNNHHNKITLIETGIYFYSWLVLSVDQNKIFTLLHLLYVFVFSYFYPCCYFVIEIDCYVVYHVF